MTETEEKIIGTWKLNSFELKNLTLNKILFPYGTNPIGILIFNNDGYMSVSIMNEERTNFQLESLQMSSVEEKVSAIETYLTYSGKWRLDNDKVYVNVETSLLPNWKDKEHFRTFQINENNLMFMTPVINQGNFEIAVELSWKKV